jgi:DHA2 family multidrug resistance protein
MMIIFRIFQGIFAASMIPLVFSGIFLIFPPERRNVINAIVGLCATMSTTIGPTLGGWITDNLSWHWLFLLNVIPGILVTYLVYNNLDIDKPNFSLFKTFDYFGLILTVISLGGVELFLSEGEQKNWFEATEVIVLFFIVTIAGILLIYRGIFHDNPLINFKAFTNRNFTIGCIISFALGFGLNGVGYLMPVQLAIIAGYNSAQIGTVMFIMGGFQIFSGILAVIIMKKFGPKTTLAIGMSFYSLSMIMCSSLNSDIGFNDFFVPQMIRGIFIMLCFMPMTAIALSTVSKDMIQSASGLYNLMRNLGGAIGIGLVSVTISSKSFEYMHNLKHFVTSDNYGYQSFWRATESLLRHHITDPMAINAAQYGIMMKNLAKQALMMAFNDAYLLIGVVSLVCVVLLIPFVRSVPPTDSLDEHGGH